MSLMETLVAAALFMLLLGIALGLLVPLLRGQLLGSARSELQEAAVVCLDRLIGEAEQCTVGGLGLYSGSDTTVLSMQRLLDVTGDIPPVQVFDSQLIVYYYQPGAQSFYRRQWPPGPPTLSTTLSATSPYRPLPAELQLLGGQANGQQSCLSSEVVAFRVTSAAPLPNIGPPLVVTLQVSRFSGGTTPENFELTRTLSLRNSE